MKMTNIIIIIVLIAGAAVFGVYKIGYEKGKKQAEKPAVAKIKEGEIKTQISQLNIAKMIKNQYATIEGVISKIENRLITLSFENESVKILVRDDAKLIKIRGRNEAKAKEAQEINFKEIEIGNRVSIFAEIRENNKLEAASVTLIPEISTPSTPPADSQQ